MSSWPDSNTSGASVTPTAPELQAGDTLLSKSSAYSVLEFIGEGCFGKVAKCQNLATREMVAVKILKDRDFIQDVEKEMSILKVISVLNPDHTNMVKFFEQFEHMGKPCLAFEMLDMNLYDLLQERNWQPLPVSEIRPIVHQLLVALVALKGLGILHADIKPDNIMLARKQDQPIRVKLIDFGGAIPASKVRPGLELQPTGYRAPEIALGCPFTEAIDMWGVGCVLAFLYLSENLFPVECDYQMMKCMVEVLGQPKDHMLRAGMYTRYFFSEEESAGGPTWRLLTPEEYTAANKVQALEQNSYTARPSSLVDLVNMYPAGGMAEFEDQWAFVDFLKKMLHLDGDLRISPSQALQHQFITMSHLKDHPDSKSYLSTSQVMINIQPMEDSAVKTSAASAGTHGNGPTTRSSNGVPVTCSYGEDQLSWYSDGELLPVSCHSHGGLTPVTSEKHPVIWYSDGELLPVSCHSHGGLTPVTSEKHPVTWYSDGELHNLSRNERTAAWFCKREALPVTQDENPAVWFSDEEKPIDSTAVASTSSHQPPKLLKKIQKFFRRITAPFCCWRSNAED